MATYLWSMLEIKGPSCYTGDRTILVVRLTFGVVSQCWCSFITFPLYVIVAQMGSKFKKTIVSENVWESLHGWRRKVKTRHGPTLTEPSSLETTAEEGEEEKENVSTSMEEGSTSSRDCLVSDNKQNKMSSLNEELQHLARRTQLDEGSYRKKYTEIETIGHVN